MLEVNTAILCASVPALKPLFTPQRIRDFRRRKHYQFHVKNDDDPFKINSQSQIQKGAFSRKQSDASLYPDLEVDTLDVTRVTEDRSAPPSPTRPTSPKPGIFQIEDPFAASRT